MNDIWDAIIVGARCAGSVTALGLARRGLRVLVLDKATFPSDTISTHVFGPETSLRLGELGLLDEIEESGAPPLTRLRMVAPDDGVEFSGRYRVHPAVPGGFCLRRTVLDDILVRAARKAGAEVREGVTVTDLRWLDGQVAGVVAHDGQGNRFIERTQVVVGADGRHSNVARWVRTRTYADSKSLAPTYYAYYRGVHGPRDAVETFHTGRRDYLILPADDGLTCAVVILPQRELNAWRAEYERSYARDLAAVPELAERFAAAERVGPVRGATDLKSYLRVPIGPGWALAGDAGACVHPIVARGIGLAIRDGDLLGEALGAALLGQRDPGEALLEYHALRDAETEPTFQGGVRGAERTGTPLPEPMLRLWHALAALPEEADRYVQNGLSLSGQDEYERIVTAAGQT